MYVNMVCVNRQISAPVKLDGKEIVAILVCFCRAAYMEIAQLNLSAIVIPQCARTDLNKRFLLKQMTTTG